MTDSKEAIPVTPIKGYRQLTKEEVDLMNEGKALAVQVGDFIDKLDVTFPKAEDGTDFVTIDKRWLSIGKTDLQKGFMAVIRSIARPETF